MTFPIGNTRSTMGFVKTQDELETTENTSLISHVAEEALTTSSQASSDSSSALDRSTLTTSAFISEAGDAAMAACSAALSTIDTSLEHIYVAMGEIRKSSSSQTELISYLDYIKEQAAEANPLYRRFNGVFDQRPVSSGAEIFCRDSIITTRPRASMECLDDISIETLPEPTPKAPHEWRSQLFTFFIELLREDLSSGALTGGRTQKTFEILTEGLGEEEVEGLKGMILTSDFYSQEGMFKLCDVMRNTAVVTSAPRLTTLFDFFQGRSESITPETLNELVSLLGDTLHLNIPENLKVFLKALTNLYSATHPSGVAPAAVAVSIFSLVVSALQSDTARRAAQYVYDASAESCAGNCGCAGCGCADGAGGCGSFGDMFCGLFSRGFNLNRDKVTPSKYKKLEDEYTPSVVLVALNNLGVNNVDLLAGEPVTLPSLSEIRAECARCADNMTRILSNKTKEMWGEAAENYPAILGNDQFRSAIVSGLSNKRIPVSEEHLMDNVMVDCSWGSKGFLSSHEPFNSRRLVHSLTTMIIIDPRTDAGNQLGGLRASGAITSVGRILTELVKEKGKLLLTSEELMTLVCIVLAERGIAVADAEASQDTFIFNDEELQDLFVHVEANRIRLEKAQPMNIREGVNTAVFYNMLMNTPRSSSSFHHKPQGNRKSDRNKMVVDMSTPWMKAAGLDWKSLSASRMRQEPAPGVVQGEAAALIHSEEGGARGRPEGVFVVEAYEETSV
ncbi:hypothetical protein [Chlamydia vaughanii]|uniref:hypothetical protein n=1 Tax=Chlamydia vaughanii TaxID=3112552 RepID=UPI0032B2C5E0